MRTRLNYLLSFILVLTLVGNLKGQGVDPGTQHLSHSWTFEDGTANDYVGGANGILMGDAEIDGGSLITVNGNSWMEMPADSIAINKYKEITIAAWYRSVANGNTGFTMLTYFGNSVNGLGSNGYFISVARGDDKSRAAISCGDEATPWASESGANGPELDDGQLHHVVSTLSDTNITLYIDGVLQQTTSLSENNTISSISENFAYLAKGGYTSDPLWLGEILEFNMYNKVLDSNEVHFLFNKGTTSVEEENAAVPQQYRLSQNYPNPFNPTTTIEFALPRRNNVHLLVVNMIGQVVKVLADGEYAAGIHSVTLDASHLASGVYFCRLQTENFINVKKLILLK
jgi:hypothetical protein